MNILSIEPTPNPNSMKLNLDQELQEGVSVTYSRENQQTAPVMVQELLGIQGVKSIFRAADFMAVERNPKADWETILVSVSDVFTRFGGVREAEPVASGVQVYVQMYQGIPMQIKLIQGLQDIRVALPERFARAAKEAIGSSTTFLTERKWEARGLFHGDPNEIGQRIKEEIDQTYTGELWEQLVTPKGAGSIEDQEQYKALEQLTLDEQVIPELAKALQHPNTSIRRLATAQLGTIGGKVVLPYLYKALKDTSVAVRRAAGDALSDIGDPDAIEAMAQALKDPSKIVRWRAARFLYEVGNESIIPNLVEALHEPEYEVKLQIQMAIDRIQNGEEAVGMAWQRMIDTP